MPTTRYTEKDYLDHARHNERFLDYLIKSVLPSSSRYADWALVVCFYTALHYTKAAILRDHGEDVAHHISYYGTSGDYRIGQNDLVREHLPAIKTAYKELFDLGHEARYRSYYKAPGSTGEVTRQRKVLDNIKLACGYA